MSEPAHARLYDFDADFDHDVAHYAELARGAEVLELACGTGRLLGPLGDVAADVVGLDLDPAMLARARSRVGDGVRLIEGDMRAFELGRRFDLIVLAANALCLLPAPAFQRRCLELVRGHLAPGGRVALDLPHPAPFLAAREPFGRELHLYTRDNPSTGLPTARYVTHQHDPLSQVIVGDSRYVEHLPDGATRTFTAREVLRYVHPNELALLLELTGFAEPALTGWFDGRAFDRHAPKLIAVAARS